MSQFGFGGQQSSYGSSASRPGGPSGFNYQNGGNGFPGGFGANPFGGNPFAGFPGGPGGFTYTSSSSSSSSSNSGRGPEHMSPDEFMKWYRTTFADAFRDLDEVLRRSGGRVYTMRSNPFGRGSNRDFDEGFTDPLEAMANAFGFRTQSERKNVGATNVSLPVEFDVVEASSETTDGRYSFGIVSSDGSDLGRVTERSFDEQKGIIADYHRGSKLVLKARWFRKPDGLEKIIIEDAKSNRIATIDGQKPRDESLIAKFISQLALKPFLIMDDQGVEVGAMTARDGLKKSIQFFNSRGQLAAISQFSAHAVYSVGRPNLESWQIEAGFANHEIDPSVFLVSSVFFTLRRRREGNFVDRFIRTIRKLFSNGRS
eukprot:TRINITY_DN1022_c0_g1_i2.p1 TRINITY_DN1022_c0_g1~~TRINITY_DN1022_c0_g1_i2.p1  ORF type:complete len:371 (+),score=49.13 TRINITY_DN1022_c0_g1_i2:571-1683(+)